MPKTKIRSFRIEDELYWAAFEKAQAEGRSLSEVLRELIERWVSTK